MKKSRIGVSFVAFWRADKDERDGRTHKTLEGIFVTSLFTFLGGAACLLASVGSCAEKKVGTLRVSVT